MPRQIVIVGAGCIGSSTAYSLVNHERFDPASDSVTLVEGTEIAAGASGKSGGFLALDWHSDATASLAELSFGLHEKWATRHPNLWGFRKLDTLAVTINTKKRASSGSVKLPAGLTWLDHGAIKSIRTLGTKSSTAQVHPRLLTQNLVRLAQEKGCKVVMGRAKRVDFDESHHPTALIVESKEGAEQSIPCTDVIITAGPWSGRLANELLGSRLRKRIHIDGTRAHSIVVKTHEALSEHALFCDLTDSQCSGEPEIYCRPDGTAYICGAGDQLTLPATAADVQVDPAKIATLKAQSAAISPSHLGQKGVVEAEQACYLPTSRNGPPIVGKLRDGVYIGAGHSCWGITLGPGTGYALAELLLEGAVKSCDISSLEP